MKARIAMAAVAVAGMALVAGCGTTGALPEIVATPGCWSEADAARMGDLYTKMAMWPAPSATMTMQDAACSRERLNRVIGRNLGPVVGYKAGLTNVAVQKRFNHDAPVRGTLYRDMILADGASVPAKFGARPVFEADLIAVVKDSGIHDAKTPMQVLQHVSAVRPFIEMPDLLAEDPTKINGVFLVSANVAARLGVMGAAIPVTASQQWVDALAGMTVRLVDGSGKELDRGPGSAILDNPMNAAIWLAKDLKDAGITLKPGDLLSLGSFTKLLPPAAGTSVRAVYDGLPGNPSVAVNFR